MLGVTEFFSHSSKQAIQKNYKSGEKKKRAAPMERRGCVSA